MALDSTYQRRTVGETWEHMQQAADRANDLGRVELSWWLRGLADGLCGKTYGGDDLYGISYSGGYEAGRQRALAEVD